MKKFEYKEENVPHGRARFAGEPTRMEYLNAMGQLGWELVNIEESRHSFAALFKREKENV